MCNQIPWETDSLEVFLRVSHMGKDVEVVPWVICWWGILQWRSLPSKNQMVDKIWERRQRPISTIFQCFCSTTPFCWGVCGQEIWWTMQWCWRKAVKDLLMNPPPQSNWMILIVRENKFSTIFLSAINTERASYFLTRGYIHTYLVQSSTIER